MTIKNDLGGSLVGAIATLPQAVAYGLIAFSPLGAEWAVAGIMASVGTAILFGVISGAVSSHPFLISGPRAVTAVVVATAIQAALSRGYAPADALLLGFAGVLAAGLMQSAAGFARLGHVVSYMPVPVLAGFVNASALLVLLNSLPTMLGLAGMSMREIFSGGIMSASYWAICVSGVTLLCNFGFEGRIRYVPAALIGLFAGTTVYHIGVAFAGQLDGPVVGYIDLTLLFQIPTHLSHGSSWTILWQEADIPLLGGLSIALLAAFDAALSGSALDMKTGNVGNINRDMWRHGLCNALMGVLGFLPGSGTLGRSMAVLNSGAETRAANIGTSVVFALILGLLTPVVAALPLWATAGMLAATAVQAIDKQTVTKIRRILGRSVPYIRVLAGDLVVTAVVVVTALALNLIAAVAVGIVLAVALFVLGMGRDPVRRIYDGGTVRSKVVRPLAQMQTLEHEGRRITVIEVQGALFFGACARLQSRAREVIAGGTEYLILDFRHLTSIDSTGSALLRALAVSCVEAGGRLVLSCIEPERRFDPVLRRQREREDRSKGTAIAPLRWIWLNLHANGVIGLIDERWIFDDTDRAIATCEEALLMRLGRGGGAGTRGVIASSATFAGLDRDQIIALGKFATRHRFAAGETVFRQREPGDRAYFLVSDRMDVLIDIPGSVRKRRVSALAEGTLFGEMGLLDGGVRSASVQAVKTASCFSIDAARFVDLQTAYPDVALILLRNLARQFSDRLRVANNVISELEQ